jgi:tetratricopeptide (TPR) repeat protein
MSEQKDLFPGYIPRADEEEQIRRVTARVKASGQSGAVLLYGVGGVGKTLMVRHLAETGAREGVIWLEPIDVDDSEYWLLPNLERKIAEDLDPKGEYFEEYLRHISQLPRVERPHIGHETVLAHLRRGDEFFRRDYERFVKESGWMPVVTLDTIEAIRGTDVLLSLTQWMKRLPGTLFILSGRPTPEETDDDPVIRELEDPYQSLPFESIALSGFTLTEALNYLGSNGVASALSEEEKKKLALLSRGHPLWLALTVDYLAREGMPREVRESSTEQLEEWSPYQGTMTAEGKRLHEAFVRRLVVPYRETDFWHEAIKRLAVVRQRVSRVIWENLMTDCSLPGGIEGWGEAWKRLLQIPWVRPRANRRYVTLHDALAEELARRIIPLHDKDESWRRRQWEVAAQVYRELTGELEQSLEEQQKSVDKDLQPGLLDDRQRELVEQVAQLDTHKRELDQLLAANLYYQMLCDFEEGCQQFIHRFDEATRKHEYRLRELLWLEMQRFLPGETPRDLLEDVIRPVVERFGEWLLTHPDVDYEIGWRGAQHLIDGGQPSEAASRLSGLLEQCSGDPEREYQLYILRGNARMRVPGQVRDAEKDFDLALERTRRSDAPKGLKEFQGQACKEAGFYYRNMGDWERAGEAYLEALTLTPFSDQPERAAIQTNLAYVQALQGEYLEALKLVDGALAVRRRRGLRRDVGMALSVKGEIYRYRRDFAEAWEAYREAEAIFQELGDWPWLGMVRQEQAICLFQASRKGIYFAEDFRNTEEMHRQARPLALQALDLCRDLSIRAYPSALNRAGRIFGYDDPVRGLRYLKEGIKVANEVADGWIWLANLIEYAELSYRTWVNTSNSEYRDQIGLLLSDIEQVRRDYSFPDLSGRWDLLQGHLKVHDALATDDEHNRATWLSQALEHYKLGFSLIAGAIIGSHGKAAIPAELKEFSLSLTKLPQATQEEWCEELRVAWSDPEAGYIKNPKQSILLLAGLTEVYEESVAQPQQTEVT